MRFFHRQEGILFFVALLWALLLLFHLRLFAGESDLQWANQHVPGYWIIIFLLLAALLPASSVLGNAVFVIVTLFLHASVWGFVAFSLLRVTGLNTDVGFYLLLSGIALSRTLRMAREPNAFLEHWLEGHVQ